MFWLDDAEFHLLKKIQQEFFLNRQQAITLAIRVMARLMKSTSENVCNTENETYLIGRGGVSFFKPSPELLAIVNEELTAMGVCITLTENPPKTTPDKTPLKHGPKSRGRRAKTPTADDIAAFWKRKKSGQP